MPQPRIAVWKRRVPARVHVNPKRIANWLPIGVFLFLVVWLYISRIFNVGHPPIGTYIGALAFVAAIVTIWPPNNAWAKAAWFLVFGWFLVLEITTLYQQRADDKRSDREKTKEEDDRFAGLLKAQQDNFAQVLDDNQKHFAATLRNFDQLGRLSTESMEELTGGDTWVAFVVVPNFPLGDPPTYELLCQITGRHPLHEVSARIRSDSQEGVIVDPRGNVLKRGKATHVFDMVTLLDKIPTLLIGNQGLTGFRVGIGKYYILTYSHNGYLGETLELSYTGAGLAVETVSVTRPGNSDRHSKEEILRQETVPLTLPSKH